MAMVKVIGGSAAGKIGLADQAPTKKNAAFPGALARKVLFPNGLEQWVLESNIAEWQP